MDALTHDQRILVKVMEMQLKQDTKIYDKIDEIDKEMQVAMYKCQYIKVRELGSIRTHYVKQLKENINVQ